MPSKKSAKKAAKKGTKKTVKKAVVKKAAKKATKKVVKKAPAAKKLVQARSVTKPISVKKAFSKSEIVQSIVETAGLQKNQAVAVLDSLTNIIESHISKKGPGVFVFPNIAKFSLVRKPATKKREGRNPFTGEPMTIAAKPARNVLKIKPLKRLKDIVK